MNLSKTSEYALRIMSYMAMDDKKLHRANDIFESLQIPFRYLRKQMTNLTKSGIIISVQGKNGGYRISRSIGEISLLDIIHATGDQQIMTNCFFGFENCALNRQCAMHDKWDEIRQNINQVLASTSLAELNENGPDNFISNNSIQITKNS
nr:Rrf2 family transcriptional regulator [Bacteroidota bacterium]